MCTKIKSSQEVYISQYVDVDVDFQIEDVFDFIDECEPDELEKIREKVSASTPGYKPTTIMEEFALRDLEEVIRYKGPEYIMSILNTHK